MIKTKITNPTAVKKSYTWFPRGLVLAPNESRLVDFDPYSNCPNKMQLGILSKDVLKGNVELTYYVEAPCKIAQASELVQPKKKKPTKETTETAPVDVSNQIKTVLEEVKDDKPQEPVVSLMDNTEIKQENIQPVDLMNSSALTDKNELLVTVSNEETPKDPTEIQSADPTTNAYSVLEVSVAETPVVEAKQTKAKKAKA